jgi:hypothetical protein
MADKLDFVLTPEVKDFFNSTILGAKPITEIALEGEPGCGKTLATRWIAEERKVPEKYLRFVCTKETSFENFTTEKIIKNGDIIEQDSMFLKLIQEPSVINVDECYLAQPDVIAGLNCLLDFDRAITLPTGRVVKRHEENILIFTSNPRNYAGVKRQHGGFLDRLPTLLMGYLNSRDEVRVIQKGYPNLPKEDVAKLVKFATFIRNGRGAKMLTTVCSTRGLLTMAQMMTNGASLELAVRSALKVPEEETKVINELMGKALNATLIKNETTGEDELVLNDKLQKQVEEMKASKEKAEAESKAWKEKANAILAALG